MISIPVMPECLEAIEEDKDLNFDPDLVNNETSALFVTSTGLGETLGPVISSYVNHYHGFTAA
jgi:hypothetical protein